MMMIDKLFSGMVIMSWISTKYFAGGHGVLTGLINCFVHVIMYFYYYLTIVYPEYKKNNWWKKYITQVQLVSNWYFTNKYQLIKQLFQCQFGIIAIHWIILLLQPSCDYPTWPAIFILFQSFYMIYLFSKFYIKSYRKDPLAVKSKKNDDYILKPQPTSKTYSVLSYDNTLI